MRLNRLLQLNTYSHQLQLTKLLPPPLLLMVLKTNRSRSPIYEKEGSVLDWLLIILGLHAIVALTVFIVAYFLVDTEMTPKPINIDRESLYEEGKENPYATTPPTPLRNAHGATSPSFNI